MVGEFLFSFSPQFSALRPVTTLLELGPDRKWKGTTISSPI